MPELIQHNPNDVSDWQCSLDVGFSVFGPEAAVGNTDGFEQEFDFIPRVAANRESSFGLVLDS